MISPEGEYPAASLVKCIPDTSNDFRFEGAVSIELSRSNQAEELLKVIPGFGTPRIPVIDRE